MANLIDFHVIPLVHTDTHKYTVNRDPPFGNRRGAGKGQGWHVSGSHTDNQGDNAATTGAHGILEAAFQRGVCGNAALCPPLFPGHQGLEFLGL